MIIMIMIIIIIIILIRLNLEKQLMIKFSENTGHSGTIIKIRMCAKIKLIYTKSNSAKLKKLD